MDRLGNGRADVSVDDGTTWKPFDANDYNAVSFADGVGWAVGSNGAILKFTFQ